MLNSQVGVAWPVDPVASSPGGVRPIGAPDDKKRMAPFPAPLSQGGLRPIEALPGAKKIMAPFTTRPSEGGLRPIGAPTNGKKRVMPVPISNTSAASSSSSSTGPSYLSQMVNAPKEKKRIQAVLAPSLVANPLFAESDAETAPGQRPASPSSPKKRPVSSGIPATSRTASFDVGESIQYVRGPDHPLVLATVLEVLYRKGEIVGYRIGFVDPNGRTVQRQVKPLTLTSVEENAPPSGMMTISQHQEAIATERRMCAAKLERERRMCDMKTEGALAGAEGNRPTSGALARHDEMVRRLEEKYTTDAFDDDTEVDMDNLTEKADESDEEEDDDDDDEYDLEALEKSDLGRLHGSDKTSKKSVVTKKSGKAAKTMLEAHAWEAPMQMVDTRLPLVDLFHGHAQRIPGTSKMSRKTYLRPVGSAAVAATAPSPPGSSTYHEAKKLASLSAVDTFEWGGNLYYKERVRSAAGPRGVWKKASES